MDELKLEVFDLDDDEDEGEDYYPEFCLRCGCDSDESYQQASDAKPEANGVQRAPNGAFLTHGGFYCAECAPDVAVCRSCGCTDERGCAGGCCWIEGDLCSSCPESETNHAA